jgi:hypothetical protein
MNVGFTGTTKGMTGDQIKTVIRLLTRLHGGGLATFHHGEEPHSDEEAASIARTLGYKVVGHPGGTAEENIRRNHEIVDASRVMVAAPRGYKEVLRSGTWATIRYARGDLKKQPPGGPRKLYIVWPNGTIKLSR